MDQSWPPQWPPRKLRPKKELLLYSTHKTKPKISSQGLDYDNDGSIPPITSTTTSQQSSKTRHFYSNRTLALHTPGYSFWTPSHTNALLHSQTIFPPLISHIIHDYVIHYDIDYSYFNFLLPSHPTREQFLGRAKKDGEACQMAQNQKNEIKRREICAFRRI